MALENIVSIAVEEQNVSSALSPIQTIAISNSNVPIGVTMIDVGLVLGGGGGSSSYDDTAIQASVASKAPIASPTFTGTVSGITKAMVGLPNADNTSDASKPVSTAQQTALDAKAPTASPTFTGTVSGVTKTHVGLSNVDNTSDANKPVSTATTTALAGKAATSHTHVSSAITDLTATVQGIVNTQLDIAGAPGVLDTINELAAAINDDANFATTMANSLALKAPLASPTFTGTVAGITKSMVGLANVDNTADTAKPVSTAQQTALNLKQDVIAAGTTAQYRRGDNTWQTLNADAVPDGTTNKAFLATERTKLTGIATGATANSTDATLLARANHTGTQSADTLTDGTTNKAYLATEKTKLAGIATAATANSTDAFLLARANHTGTQTSGTISDFTEAAQDAVAAMLAQGTNVTLTYSDATNSLTIDSAGAAGGLDAEGVRDAIGIALVGTGVISVVPNDALDTITVSSTATANATDASLRDRSTHTGTQSADTLTDGTTNKAFLATERTKLTGVATGATANSSDATLLARANHTGTQLASTISDSTAFGRSILNAADATAARALTGAGTSSLVIGTTGTTAKAGNYTPPVADIPGGFVMFSTNPASRPTARTDIKVFFITATDPAAVSLDDDVWIRN